MPSIQKSTDSENTEIISHEKNNAWGWLLYLIDILCYAEYIVFCFVLASLLHQWTLFSFSKTQHIWILVGILPSFIWLLLRYWVNREVIIKKWPWLDKNVLIETTPMTLPLLLAFIFPSLR